MRGIILVARARIRESLAGVVTAMATIPAVVVAGGGIITGMTPGRKLVLEIGYAGL